MEDPQTIVTRHLAAHHEAMSEIDALLPQLVELGQLLKDCLEAGGKVLLFGNGGSAADAQHLATELVVRYRRNRKALAALALTTDTSTLTAAANDFGYAEVFARQVEAHVSKGDVVIGISTSGTSPNVLRGLAVARENGAISIGMTGRASDALAEVSDHLLCAPSEITAVIQECHILCGHILCDLVEEPLGEG